VGIMSTGTSEARDRLIGRLRYLWTFELFDSFALPALAVFVSKTLGQPLGLFAVYSAGLVTWLLWQGAAYWYLQIRAIRAQTRLPPRYLRWFRALKTSNWVLIGLLPVFLVLRGVTGSPFSSAVDLGAGLALYLLAVLEQVNYYYYQLMYDNPADWQYLRRAKRLRQSKLSRALERLAAAEQDAGEASIPSMR